MAQLPSFQTNDLVLSLMQNRWAAILNPIIANPINNAQVLKNVALSAGANTINHKLGRNPQGWIIVDSNAAATVFRSQPYNDTTLTLTSSAPVTVSIGVF